MLSLAPQTFRVIAKNKDPEYKSFGENKCVLNFVAVPTSQRPEEETIWIQMAAWNQKADKLNGNVQHGDTFLIGGDLTAKKGSQGDKIFYSVNINSISRVKLERLVPQEGSDEEPSDYVKSAKIAASSVADEPDAPF